MQLHKETSVQTEPDTTAPAPGAPALTAAEDIGRRMLHQRRVMLTGAIDGPLAERVCTQLLVIEAENPDLPITLYLHSPGGEVDAGFAIYDTMQALRCDVATVCLGFAASMAQFLLCGGTPGMRSAHAHSRILMHQPLGSVSGYAVDIAIQAEQFTVMRRLMAELTAQHTGQPVDRVLADGERDRWFTPEEARDYGMIDDIIGAPDVVAPDQAAGSVAAG